MGAPWLWLVRAVAASPQGLAQFSMSGPVCNDVTKTTPAVPRDATFKPGSPVKTSFFESGTTGTRLTLTGTVSGVTCGRIKGATVDFWQTDAAGVYDMTGYRFRGHQATNATGGFELATVIPGAAKDRARHIGVNVSVPGKADFWTEIFFPDDPLQATDRRFVKDLLAKVTPDPRTANAKSAVFDVILDL